MSLIEEARTVAHKFTESLFASLILGKSTGNVNFSPQPVHVSDIGPIAAAENFRESDLNIEQMDTQGLLPKDVFGCTTLHKAARQGQSDVVYALLEKNAANLYTKGPRGVNALHMLAYGGHLDLLESVIETHVRNGSVDATDDDGWTCLHYTPISAGKKLRVL